MTDLVVDSSVAVKWFMTEAHTPEALRILTAYRNGKLRLLAPDLVYAEFGNIIWKKQVFQGLDAIVFKKRKFTTKITKNTKRGKEIQGFQALGRMILFVLFVSSWFYFLEVYTTAEAVIHQFSQLQIRVTLSQPLLEDAYNLASAHKRTVYDSLYLALSQREQCQFVTADEKLVNAIGSVFPQIVLLANWP